MIEELGLEVLDSYRTDDRTLVPHDVMLYVKFNNDVTLTAEGEYMGVDLHFNLSVDNNRHRLFWPNFVEDEACMYSAHRPNKSGTSTFYEGQLHFFLDKCLRRMIT